MLTGWQALVSVDQQEALMRRNDDVPTSHAEPGDVTAPDPACGARGVQVPRAPGAPGCRTCRLQGCNSTASERIAHSMRLDGSLRLARSSFQSRLSLAASQLHMMKHFALCPVAAVFPPFCSLIIPYA